MAASECRIETDRAGRYLVQLCRHARFMSGMQHPAAGASNHRPPRVTEVSYTGTSGLVRFEDGAWLLTAHPDALHLRVEAADSATLARLEAGISARIRTVGRRDRLEPVWSPVSATPSALAGTPVRAAGQRRTRPTHTVLLLALLIALVAAHLGVAAALADAFSTGWIAVAGLLVVGAAVLAAHALIGHAVLSGGRLPGHWPYRPRRHPRPKGPPGN